MKDAIFIEQQLRKATQFKWTAFLFQIWDGIIERRALFSFQNQEPALEGQSHLSASIERHQTTTMFYNKNITRIFKMQIMYKIWWVPF